MGNKFGQVTFCASCFNSDSTRYLHVQVCQNEEGDDIKVEDALQILHLIPFSVINHAETMKC